MDNVKPRPGTPRTWTLRAKLVASVTALFVIVSLLIGALTVSATHTYLLGRTDTELRATADRISSEGSVTVPAPAPGRRGGQHRGDGGPPGGNSSSLVVVLDDGMVQASRAVTLDNRQTELTADQLDTLRAAELSDRPTEVDLGDQLGTYRLIRASSPQGLDVIAGLRTGPVQATVRAVALIVGLGLLIGTGSIALLGTIVISRNLAPLRRVAGTAKQVSTLTLDSGDVALAHRVPPQDTNPQTEVGAVGQALNDLLDHVEQALRSRHESETRVRQFVADASHELRTPLASIRGYAELTRRDVDTSGPAVGHVVSRIEAESLRMQGLVDDLLLLARLDSGRPLAQEPVDLTGQIVSAVSDAHASAPDHRWLVDLPDDPIEVTGDGARLYQIVANLLANAGTHTPPGTMVRTGLQIADGWVRLTVTDDGPGISAAFLPDIFERFSRGDPARSRSAGSTGLGLSIVRAVAESHGGEVAVESRPGHTAFTVRLPAHSLTSPDRVPTPTLAR